MNIWLWIPCRIIAAVIISSSVVFISVQFVAADPLPFNDGRYVTKRGLCALSVDEAIKTYGDQIALMERNIKGDTLDNGYELFCKIRKPQRHGADVVFDASCDSEGGTKRIKAKYTFVSSNEFKIGNLTYFRCTAGVQKNTNKDGLDATTSEIIDLWLDANARCRGGPGNSPKTLGACGEREQYGEILEGRDWCYGKYSQPDSQAIWHPCEAGSLRVKAQ